MGDKMRALITGSTSGIGNQIAKDLINRYWYVYFTGRTPLFIPEPLGQFIKTDLSNYNEISKISDNIENLDALILNAGTTDRTKFGEITLDNWNRVLNVNLTNQFFLIQNLKDKIKENGKIIFITSISGIIPDATSISYGVSKAAENMLVHYLVKEFASKHITVNAIAPGYTLSPWHVGKEEAQLKRIGNKCYAERLGTCEEISKIVMAVIDNNYINGQVIRIDGGWKQ